MSVAGKKYTDFFVFTYKGSHKERIYFDPKFWSDVLTTLVWFWYKYVGPELITHELKNHLEKEVLSEKDCLCHVKSQELKSQNKLKARKKKQKTEKR